MLIETRGSPNSDVTDQNFISTILEVNPSVGNRGVGHYDNKQCLPPPLLDGTHYSQTWEISWVFGSRIGCAVVFALWEAEKASKRVTMWSTRKLNIWQRIDVWSCSKHKLIFISIFLKVCFNCRYSGKIKRWLRKSLDI